MSDNILVTPGIGATIAADDISGVLHQRIKLTWGVDGSAVDASATNPLPITVANASLAVTAASLPLPSGAATAAKQPALGTAGTASTDVLTVQGIASMTALKVDGSAVTQPVSGSLTTVSTVTSLSQFAGNAINLGAGAVGTGTLRVTQASDSPLVAATGAIGDSAWASGNGTVVSLLKTVATAALDTTTVSPVKIDQTTPGTTDAVTVKTPADVVSFTPTLDTVAYASGDVLFATASIGNITRANDGRAILMSLTGIDKSKNKPAMTILFYQTNVTSAAANAANNLSDSDQANLLGYVRIAATDWIDYANNSILCKTAINLLLEAVSGAQNVYAVGILDAGTPTFAAGDLVFKFGFLQS